MSWHTLCSYQYTIDLLYCLFAYHTSTVPENCMQSNSLIFSEKQLKLVFTIFTSSHNLSGAVYLTIVSKLSQVWYLCTCFTDLYQSCDILRMHKWNRIWDYQIWFANCLFAVWFLFHVIVILAAASFILACHIVCFLCHLTLPWKINYNEVHFKLINKSTLPNWLQLKLF